LPAQPTPAQSQAAHRNGALSHGPATAEGKARSARNAVRHGLAGERFFLLADEDADDYAGYEALWLRTYGPVDAEEHAAALDVVHARWREMRADRLEAQVLSDLFAAGSINDEAEAAAAKQAGMRALAILLRYRARIQREHDRAMARLDALLHRPGRPRPVAVRSEPERPPSGGAPVPAARHQPEPARTLNRHERRRLAAQARKTVPKAA
jgi:hypothetical protein